MTVYVHAPNGVVADYPYTYAQLRADNPNVSFPSEPGEWLAEYDVYPVADTPQPPSTLTSNFVEGTPVLAGGVWTQAWDEVAASPEQIAKRAEAAAQLDELDAAKLDAWIVAYLGMTPTEAMNYINGNSATLTALRTNVARLAYAVRVLIRREFNR